MFDWKKISYKFFIGAKPLRIWLKKLDGIIKIYDRIRYLVLLVPEICNAIYDRTN